jgi:hypothetical protein
MFGAVGLEREDEAVGSARPIHSNHVEEKRYGEPAS